MERIEYVSRREDLVAFRDSDRKHISPKLGPSTGTRKILISWLTLNGVCWVVFGFW